MLELKRISLLIVFQCIGILYFNRVNAQEILLHIKGEVVGEADKPLALATITLLDRDEKDVVKATTDSNGYFGFNVEMGRYLIEFEKPYWLEFTKKNVGADAEDSDLDQASGRTDPIDVSDSSLLSWDAGLVTSSAIHPTPDPSLKLPAAEVGPIRSGRIFL